MCKVKMRAWWRVSPMGKYTSRPTIAPRNDRKTAAAATGFTSVFSDAALATAPTKPGNMASVALGKGMLVSLDSSALAGLSGFSATGRACLTMSATRALLFGSCVAITSPPPCR